VTAEKPRRRKGEGTILFDAKAHRYRGRLLFDGKMHWVSGPTDQAVSDALAKLRTTLLAGKAAPNSRETISQYLKVWIDRQKRLAPKTYQTYRGLVDNHIIPGIGTVRLVKLLPSHVQRLVDDRAKYLSPRSVEQMRAVLRKALNDAMKDEKIERNVAQLVDLPEKDDHEIAPLTPRQTRTLLEKIRGDDLEALYITAIACGLRQSELLGLRWEYQHDGEPVRDVDFERGTLTVRYALHRVGGKWVFRPPKTKKSRRTIALPEIAASALRAHQREQEKNLEATKVKNKYGLVFTRKNGEPVWGTSERKRLQRILKDAELPQQRFHDLRHLSASLMAAQGVPLKDVSATLGHSQIGITADLYSHMFDEGKREVARRMDAILSG
jgi:integrase